MLTLISVHPGDSPVSGVYGVPGRPVFSLIFCAIIPVYSVVQLVHMV